MSSSSPPDTPRTTACSTQLYRSVVSPRVGNLFFIGNEATTFNNVLTSGLQSLWLLHLLLGGLRLPHPREQLADTLSQQRWRQRVMPPQLLSSSALMLYQQRYHDQLLADMGHQPRRKRAARRGGSECFGLYTSEDYAELFREEAIPGLAEAAAAAAAAAPQRTAAEVVAAAVTLMPAAAAIGARLDLAVMAGGGGGGGGSTAAGGQNPRRAVLLPVCASNNSCGGAAIAVAVGGGTSSEHTSALVTGANAAGPATVESNSYIGSFDSPRVGSAAAAAAARGRVAEGAPPSAPLEPLRENEGSGGKQRYLRPPVAADGGGMCGDGLLDNCFNCNGNCSGCDGRVSNGPSADPAAATCLDTGGAASIFTTTAAVSFVRQPPAAAVAPPPVPLAHRVRLHVLHLINRSSSGAHNSGGGGGGGAANASHSHPHQQILGATEDVLELQMPSSYGILTSRQPDSSLAATSLAAGGAGGVGLSSSMCFDMLRHGAPNVYHELVGTLDVN
ncbi:hypothetical protein Agub_g8365 [Astrephomene gubernaculifera]|uniref:Uncharacterized protein n=1 Tax=Astrephomene gubernaculifera TaxID=47775 RepID=A0AAD3DTG3_9CHLO|nr:hypothetical protein Agub_g8365 [Astrephomene gubernaculifera]